MTLLNLKLVSDYKDNDILRASFNKLARQTFGIQFEEWYQKGLWDNKYICYSYITDESVVVSNLSINKMEVILNGELMKAIQIGTVMTHTMFRNKGLSRKLLEHVLDIYKPDYQLFYLFANQSVLEFYPKFGFEPIPQTQYWSEINLNALRDKSKLLKLDVSKNTDFELIQNLAKNRQAISQVFGVVNNPSLIMFYCMFVYNDCLYYSEEQDVLVIYKQEEDLLHLYDIISPTAIDFSSLLPKIANKETKTIQYYFTPDLLSIDTSTTAFEATDVLFCLPSSKINISNFMSPKTAQA
jgi:predicted acetyltransferase